MRSLLQQEAAGKSAKPFVTDSLTNRLIHDFSKQPICRKYSNTQILAGGRRSNTQPRRRRQQTQRGWSPTRPAWRTRPSSWSAVKSKSREDPLPKDEYINQKRKKHDVFLRLMLIYLLAPTGALVVMMVYYMYIRSSSNFFRFSLIPLMQLILQMSL